MAKALKMCAWALKHDSHGIVLDNLVFLPEGDKPETDGIWIRLPWLDGTLTPEMQHEICGVFEGSKR